MRRWIVACALMTACLPALLLAQGQAPYSSRKTPWGDRDLQAAWSGDSAFGIPLQRPTQLGAKAELTDAEFAEKLTHDERTR